MEIKLSNGQLLQYPCKVRVPKHLPWEIPNCVVHMLGIELDNDPRTGYSSGSEVIIWSNKMNVLYWDERLRRFWIEGDYDSHVKSFYTQMWQDYMDYKWEMSLLHG